MTAQIAQLHTMLCLATVFFQLALIGGAPLGQWTQGGRVAGVLPLSGRLVAAVSVPVLLFQALAVVSAAGFPLGWPLWTGWVAVGVNGLACVLNAVTPSERERAVWFPVSLIMVALSGYVLLMTLRG